jgi:hypothetical protein
MTSPGEASWAKCAAREPGKNTRAPHRHLASGADVFYLLPPWKPAGRHPYKGDAVAALWVEVGLHLAEEARRRQAPRGEIGRGSAGSGRGSVARFQPLWTEE